MQQGLRALQIAERAGVTVCYGTDLLVSMHALQTEEVSRYSVTLRVWQLIICFSSQSELPSSAQRPFSSKRRPTPVS